MPHPDLPVASQAMASLRDVVSPVLGLLQAVEVSMLGLGQVLWRHAQSHASGAYEGVKRRASDTYDDWQVKAGGTYREVQGRAAEACQRWLNRASLVFIQSQLCLSLAIHRWHFKLSLMVKDARHRLARCLSDVGTMHQWGRLKVAGWKRSAARSAKVNLERASRKAREYESVFSDDFQKLSRSSSTASSFSIFSSTQRLHHGSKVSFPSPPPSPSRSYPPSPPPPLCPHPSGRPDEGTEPCRCVLSCRLALPPNQR